MNRRVKNLFALCIVELTIRGQVKDEFVLSMDSDILIYTIYRKSMLEDYARRIYDPQTVDSIINEAFD